MKLKIDDIHAFIFDFDGVLTNNKVYTDSSGNESVICSRSDGLGFNALKILGVPSFIVSSEKNKVVSMRAEKLAVPTYQGIKNKKKLVMKLIQENNFDLNQIFYVGNDINDYHSMVSCGISACPNDSNTLIKEISKYNLKSCGGEGVVREILEEIFNLNLLEILYSREAEE